MAEACCIQKLIYHSSHDPQGNGKRIATAHSNSGIFAVTSGKAPITRDNVPSHSLLVLMHQSNPIADTFGIFVGQFNRCQSPSRRTIEVVTRTFGDHVLLARGHCSSINGGLEANVPNLYSYLILPISSNSNSSAKTSPLRTTYPGARRAYRAVSRFGHYYTQL